MTRREDQTLPISVIIDLYIRLRDEIDVGRRAIDPTDTIRATIAMAVLTAVSEIPNNISRLEAKARWLLKRQLPDCGG